MTVGELKTLLENIDDDMVVMIPLDDDMFISPCVEESGVEDLLLGEFDEDDEPDTTFVLVPCGFYCGIEEEIDPQMN